MKRLIEILNIILLGTLSFLGTFHLVKKNYRSNVSKEIFESEYKRISHLSDGANKLVHFPAGDNYMKGALSSPDALFSMMSFDLAEKPLGVYLPLPASPWAITMYDENCNPFYSLDERSYGRHNLQVILYRIGQPVPQKEGVLQVKSPGSKGIIFMRLVLPGGSGQNTVAALRSEMRTGPIK